MRRRVVGILRLASIAASLGVIASFGCGGDRGDGGNGGTGGGSAGPGGATGTGGTGGGAGATGGTTGTGGTGSGTGGRTGTGGAGGTTGTGGAGGTTGSGGGAAGTGGSGGGGVGGNAGRGGSGGAGGPGGAPGSGGGSTGGTTGTGGAGGTTGSGGSAGTGGTTGAGGTTGSGGSAGTGGTTGTGGAGGTTGTGGMQPTERFVFVTSATYNGDLREPGTSGPAGADLKCQRLAAAAGLPGTYKAWLSAPVESATSRLRHSTVPYVLPGPDRPVVASNWNSLISGFTLAHALDRDERGNTVGRITWTGSDSDGTFSGSACGEWNSIAPSATGSTGYSSETDNDWTSFSFDYACATALSLYCFQQ